MLATRHGHGPSPSVEARKLEIQEKFPERKKAKDPNLRNLRLTGHNLFDVKDEKGNPVHSKYTKNQRTLLRKVWDLNLRDFIGKYERQRDLIIWVLSPLKELAMTMTLSSCILSLPQEEAH